MGWTTIYINGRPGGEAEILNSLTHSGINFMPGYANEKGLILFWVDESESLRSFKKAIGSKIIFKYRLRFFTTIEAFVESNQDESNQDILSSGEGFKENESWLSESDMNSRDRLSA
mgnify:CR=1 FL=1